MSQIVSVHTHGDLAKVCINNPPVNATSTLLRAGLLEAVSICSTMGVKAVILFCKGSSFIAGGDMKEFDAPPEAPELPDVVQAIEDSKIPWVAAMHGTVLGGGFEIAMGCAFRVALDGTRFGMPEVKVGLVPGAGGTQRLPRLIGLKHALDIITTGRLLNADELHRLGGLDVISDEGSALKAALAFCATLPKPPTVVSHRPCETLSDTEIEQLRKRISLDAKGQISPLQCLDAVLLASRMKFPNGQRKERTLHLKTRASPQSRALRHAFFAERAAAKPLALGGIVPQQIENVAVVGGGLMGAGITYSCLQAGFHVTMLERDDTEVKLGVDRITKLIGRDVKRRREPPDKVGKLLKNLRVGADYQLAENTDLAIEAVYEDLALKRFVFKNLNDILRPDAILATNTSYIDPEEIMHGIKHPERCIGMHFFSPAHIMKLLEIVTLPTTDPAVLATGFLVAKKLRKVAVLSGICDGFIGNRILAAYRREADYLLMDGALPQEIDSAMRSFGMPMGPYELQDLTGLQISWGNRKRMASSRPANERYADIADKLCEMGRFGQRSGKGWYQYMDNNRKPVPDPYVTKLIQSYSNGLGSQKFTKNQIVDRILAVIINEGARIIEEGIAERPLDVDMVMIHGYGFPRWRGGPMHYASEIGIDKVRKDMADVAAQSPGSWIISKMLA